MTIIARARDLDDETALRMVVPLRGEPFPGDTINLRDGRRVMVIRRAYNELTEDADDNVDLELDVRKLS